MLFSGRNDVLLNQLFKFIENFGVFEYRIYRIIL